jgi:hypothetical protein
MKIEQNNRRGGRKINKDLSVGIRPKVIRRLLLFVTTSFFILLTSVARSENLFVSLPFAGGYAQADGSAIEDNYTFRLGSFTLDPDTDAAGIAALLTGNNAVANLTNGANFREFGTLAWDDRDFGSNLVFQAVNDEISQKSIFLVIFNTAAINLTGASQIGVFRFYNEPSRPWNFDLPDGSLNDQIDLAPLAESDPDSDGFFTPFFGNLRFNDSSNTTTILAEAAGGLAITSGNPPQGVEDDAYAGYRITANNGATLFSATGLPAGLSVNPATGEISGTPTESGPFNVTLTANNPLFVEVSKSVTLTVAAAVGNPPVITPPSAQTLVRTASFSLDISATENPTSYNLQGAPTGLSINAQGQIRGSTTAPADDYVLTVSAANLGGRSQEETFTLTVSDPTVTPSVAVVNGLLNVAITPVTMAISAGTTATFSASLPAGLSIDPITGTISGRPTSLVATAVSTIVANFGSAVTATTDLEFTVVSALPALLSLPAGESELTRNSSVNFSLEIDASTGSVGPYIYSVEGSLPPGISLDGTRGTISGSPNTLGEFPVVFRASNSAGTSRDLAVTFTVEAPTPQITGRLFAGGGVNKPFIYNARSNDTHTWQVIGAPSWLGLSGNKLSGVPSAAGTYTVTLVASTTGRLGNAIEDRESLTITVTAGRPNPSAFSFASGIMRVGVPVWHSNGAEGLFLLGQDQGDNSSMYFNATGLPEGLNFGKKWVDDSANADPLVGSWIDTDVEYKRSARRRGMITGTPLQSGTFPVTIYIQNGSGYIKKPYTLTVLP